MAHEFKKGDLVKHKASFLKSIGWFMNVPINGKITDVREDDSDVVEVEWNDHEGSRPINVCNIMLFGKPDYSGL